MTKKYSFTELLKKYTSIDPEFIDIFFNKFKVDNDLQFNIDEKDLSKYLNIKLKTLRKRLNNEYGNNNNYIEKVDFIKIKLKNNNKIKYMLNYRCMEKLAMSGDTEESENVRTYFTKLREFIYDNQELINQSLDNYTDLKKYRKYDCIYFFAVDEQHNIFKIGTTMDIINRLRVYNTGRIEDIDLKYLAIVKNGKLIENCIKKLIKNNEIIKNRELYEIEPKYLKKIIYNCYIENVDKEDNDDLYMELSNLLGLYSYVKNKKDIKPYIVIGDDVNI
jgi:hypothetical protein